MYTIDIFPWSDNLNTGLAEIDEQHQRLVLLLNQLANHAAFQFDTFGLDAIFDELEDYCAYHFQSEEAIWHEYLAGDPLEANHRETHHSFILTVQRLKAQKNIKPIDSVIVEILSFLASWLASHILENDRYMAMVVLSMQSGLSFEQAKEQAKGQLNGSMRVLIDIILSTYSSLATNTLQMMKEVSERKKAEQQLRIAAIAFESQEGMLITDDQNKILRVNRAFTHITGYTNAEVIGKSPRIFSSGRQDSSIYAAMWENINKTGRWEGEFWNLRKNGEAYLVYLTLSAVKDPDAVITNYVGTYNDITVSKAAADEINNLAFYDPLTLLPNRRLLMNRLNQALAFSARSGKEGVLLLIDLDDFKTLNDTLGHDIGDLLLQQVAQRLKTCVREGDTVARLGGGRIRGDAGKPERTCP